MSRAIGVTQFLNKTFDTFEFSHKWKETIGEPEKNFVAIIYGQSGNGKTDFAVKFAKYLASFTKVDYFSFEEGISKTLQEAIKRNNMKEVAGKIMFIDKTSFTDMIARLSTRGSAKIVFIDSLDYMNLTTQQFKQLRKKFPRKAFVIISWSKSGEPKSQYAKDIKYMSDVKVRVNNFKAYPVSRFGGYKPFVIWDRKPKSGEQTTLL